MRAKTTLRTIGVNRSHDTEKFRVADGCLTGRDVADISRVPGSTMDLPTSNTNPFQRDRRMKQKLIDVLPTRVYLELKHWRFQRDCPGQFDQMQDLRITTDDRGYSYKPFDQTRSIFVHIPKCAGVAVSRAIFGGLAGGHVTLDRYVDIFGPKCIVNYFKFTIVRNPWDRLVSAYFFLKSGGFEDDDKTWFEKELGSFPDFETFVKKWLNRSNIWKWHHFRPQYHYVLEKRGKINLDFIGFMENIGADFSYIADRVCVQGSLETTNTSRHVAYTDYYTDETRKIVANVYAEDIKMLGYNFDNSSLAQQVASRNAGKVYSLRSARS